MRNKKINKVSMVVVTLLISLSFLTVNQVYALNTTYNNEASFLAELGTYVTDEYLVADYGSGFQIISNSAMSSVLGETKYTTTGFANWNILQGNETYCAGCNGSFNLDFTSTSVGNSNGVYGAGLTVNNQTSYYAFITYGNDVTQNVLLGAGYWGFTSDDLIKNIHIGLMNGGTTTSGAIVLDDLTVGSNGTAVPEPATMLLLGLGLMGLAGVRRKIKK